MIILFFIFFILIFYTYIGYPLLLQLLMKIRHPAQPNKTDITPFISVVIPAYNEELCIYKKLDNVLALDYPGDKIEIVVASDASDDNTDEIVLSYQDKGVRLSRIETRGGKIVGYKKALFSLKGEIVVFTDATSFLERDSLKELVRSFADQTVGCVGGRLEYYDPDADNVGKGEHTYWGYETRVKIAESLLSSLTSVSGTFYAVRKHLFPLDMPDDLADDLIVPFYVKAKGYRVVLEPRAVCGEATVVKESQEIKKRYRITIQNIRGLLNSFYMLNVFRYGLYSWMLISHKLLRLLSPFFLIGLLVTNFYIVDHFIFLLFFFGQLIFYWLGGISHFAFKHRPSLINAVHYFCLSNYAILIGFVRFCKGERVAVWETERAE